MTLDEIKNAVDEGLIVHWKNDGYEVQNWSGDYNIVCISNNHAIGLTWRDGVTMNALEKDFYIGRENEC